MIITALWTRNQKSHAQESVMSRDNTTVGNRKKIRNTK